MWVHVELGSGERESILVHEIGSYARHAKEGMQRAVAANGPTEPIPCDHCGFCEFRSVCTAHWETVDHLSAWPDAPRPRAAARGGGCDDADGARELPPTDRARSAAGHARRIDTAGAPPAGGGRGCHTAATSCCRSRRGGASRGCPSRSLGDVMFDIEGDPFWTPARGLQFLFGIAHPRRRRAGATSADLGARPADEKVGVRALASICSRRARQVPDMHVYHYSVGRARRGQAADGPARHARGRGRRPAAPRGLRRPATVVRQALRAGVRATRSSRRSGSPASSRAADDGCRLRGRAGLRAVVDSERQAELEAIAAYNEEDCLATRRAARLAAGGPAAREHRPRSDASAGAGRGGRRDRQGA